MLLVFLIMDEPADSTAPSKGGRHSTLTPEIQEKLLAYVRKGLTYDRAGEALGISPATIQNWQARNKQFNNALKKARRDLEASLLDSINLAGEKSWQARAWMAERIFQYAQPSARLQVSQDITHGISGNLASLLAGIAGRKKITEAKKIEEVRNQDNYIDVKPLADNAKNQMSHNKKLYQISQVADSQGDNNNVLPKPRHKQMRRRKPRAESLAKYPTTTTPPANPPAPI